MSIRNFFLDKRVVNSIQQSRRMVHGEASLIYGVVGITYGGAVIDFSGASPLNWYARRPDTVRQPFGFAGSLTLGVADRQLEIQSDSWSR